MSIIERRVTRLAGTPINVTYTDGFYAGRAEYAVATGFSADGPRWWRIVLAPLVSAFNGKETANNGIALQGGESWARIKLGDSLTPPVVVTWPALGGIVWVMSSTVEVSALVDTAATAPAAGGPSWGVTIDDEPLDIGDRSSWVGMSIPTLTLNPGAISTQIAPPYARAMRIAPILAGVVVTLEQLDQNGTGVGAAFPPAMTVPFRWELDPRCAAVRIFNPGITPVGVCSYWEVAP